MPHCTSHTFHLAFQVMLGQLERMQQEDREAAQRKKERAQMLMTEASKFNELNIQLKKQQTELARLEDIKAVEFLKAKAEREEALQQEEERKKKERELELARLLSLQEHALDQVTCANWLIVCVFTLNNH